jgi:hypothetical protein
MIITKYDPSGAEADCHFSPTPTPDRAAFSRCRASRPVRRSASLSRLANTEALRQRVVIEPPQKEGVAGV